jgi:transcriptional regulator of acetoin/glycerol metabolism
VELEHLPEAIREPPRAPAEGAEPATDDGRPLTDEEERHKVELAALLQQHGGNISAVARACGKARMQIHRWIKRYRLELGDFRR